MRGDLGIFPLARNSSSPLILPPPFRAAYEVFYPEYYMKCKRKDFFKKMQFFP